MSDDHGRTLKRVSAFVFGGIWETATVDEQPELTLTAWSVRQLPSGDRHFVGWCQENREGRVSSVVEQFDPKTKLGRTRSGRVYKLAGHAGHDGDAEYVWRAWLRINDGSSWTDVTEDVTDSQNLPDRSGYDSSPASSR